MIDRYSRHILFPGIGKGCISATLPSVGVILTCDTAGIISPAPWVIGSLQAAEAMKILVGAKNINLDLEGICASTGSACSSESLEPSHILLALGLPPEQAHGSLRLTLGKWTNEEEINRVLEVLPRVVAKLRAMSPLLRSHK